MKTVKRVFVYILGFFLLAIGINISKLASLGISPVSSMPYTVELVWGIELGKATIITYIGLILFQILLLGKEYKIRNLLQFISTYLLGTLITYTSSEYLLFWMPAPVTYIITSVA